MACTSAALGTPSDRLVAMLPARRCCPLEPAKGNWPLCTRVNWQLLPPTCCPLLAAPITNCSVYGKALGPFGAADIAESVGCGVAGTGDQVSRPQLYAAPAPARLAQAAHAGCRTVRFLTPDRPGAMRASLSAPHNRVPGPAPPRSASSPCPTPATPRGRSTSCLPGWATPWAGPTPAHPLSGRRLGEPRRGVQTRSWDCKCSPVAMEMPGCSKRAMRRSNKAPSILHPHRASACPTAQLTAMCW